MVKKSASVLLILSLWGCAPARPVIDHSSPCDMVSHTIEKSFADSCLAVESAFRKLGYQIKQNNQEPANGRATIVGAKKIGMSGGQIAGLVLFGALGAAAMSDGSRQGEYEIRAVLYQKSQGETTVKFCIYKNYQQLMDLEALEELWSEIKRS